MSGSPQTTPDPIRVMPLMSTTSDAYADLRRSHPDWAAAISADQPVYAITTAAIEVLARPSSLRSPAAFAAHIAESERRFTALCDDHCCVGFVRGSPITYDLLAGRLLDTSDPIFPQLGYTPAHLARLDRLADQGEAAHRRLRGVVGWLLTEPTYLREVEELRTRPGGDARSFPLRRSTEPPAADTKSGARVRRFLDRWGLMGLATWDLPNPQGPLLPDMLPPGAPAKPTHGVSIFLPVHYPLQGDDDMHRRILQLQRQRAGELGIPTDFAGNTHIETYERMFRILHIERAIRSRFAHPPRGLVTQIEAAAAEALGLSADRVKRLRRWIATCRAGKRQTIRELRVTS